MHEPDDHPFAHHLWADPRERLRAVRTAMDRNKAAGPLKGAGAVAVLADQLPPLAHRFGAPLAATIHATEAGRHNVPATAATSPSMCTS